MVGISLIVLPLYIKHMGVEAYGLVGFFSMLQALFNLLDIGLTPTVARETACFRGGIGDALNYRRLIRSLEGIFLIITLIGGGTLLLTSEYIASEWLKFNQLSIGEVKRSLQLMSIIVAMRWMSGLYRGIISGSEKLVLLGIFNSVIATFRFLGVFPIFIFWGVTPTFFFVFQLCVALIELISLVFYSYGILPKIPSITSVPWSLKPIIPVLKFSLTIAFASIVWITVTQADKLLLSKLIPLTEYGYFTLAVLVASGVTMMCNPISGAIMPRMATLEAEGEKDNLLDVYRQSTQFVTMIACASSITIFFKAEPLLRVWTGNRELANQAAPILILYAIGNSISVISAFPYYLQYAKGNLRLHFIGNVFFIVILIPSIIWAANKYGGIGAGYVWLSINLFFFVAFVPIVHHKLTPGLNIYWFIQDIFAILLPSIIVGFLVNSIFIESESKLLSVIKIMSMGFIVMSTGALASSSGRSRIKKYISHFVSK